MLRDLRYRIRLFSTPGKEFYSFIKKITGFSPIKLKLYDMAFVHKSASLTDLMGIPVNNERLEYLGDAILGAVVADYLYNRFPHKDEGFLTQMRSRIVNRSFLTQLTFKLGIDHFVNSNTHSVNENSHIYGDVFEAFVGAIYLDVGYEGAKIFIIKKILSVYVDVDEIERSDNNFKSQLIEWCQKNKREVEFDTRENHDQPQVKHPFITTVLIDGEIVGKGLGYSKKEAQQNSAENAMTKLGFSRSNAIHASN